MTYLLDSDILTHGLYGRRPVTERIDGVRPPDAVGVAEVTRAEALKGRTDAVLKAANGATALRAVELLRRSETYIARFPLVPLTLRRPPTSTGCGPASGPGRAVMPTCC